MAGKLPDSLIPKVPEPNKDGLIWRDVSNEIKLKDGKGNPYGWSYYRMEWNGETVGHINSGSPSISGENWQMVESVDPVDKMTHFFFFKGMFKSDWEAVDFVNGIRRSYK